MGKAAPGKNGDIRRVAARNAGREETQANKARKTLFGRVSDGALVAKGAQTSRNRANEAKKRLLWRAVVDWSKSKIGKLILGHAWWTNAKWWMGLGRGRLLFLVDVGTILSCLVVAAVLPEVGTWMRQRAPM